MDENKEIPQWAIDLKLDTTKYTHEFENEEYTLYYDNERQERFIEVNDKKQKHYLIESQKQINNRLENKNYDFRDCIFTCEASFDFKCLETPLFSFTNVVFIEKATFMGTVFKCAVSFLDVIFKKEVNFHKSEFLKNTEFLRVNFDRKVNFLQAKFKDRANFVNISSIEKINFLLASFEKNISFAKIISINGISLSCAHINEGLTLVGGNEDVEYNFFNLNLTGTSPRHIFYNAANISTVLDRQTWLVLKQAAIKQNDHISALEFHKKEMLQYTDDLKKSANKNIKDIKQLENAKSIDNQSINNQDKDDKIIKDKGARLILLFEKYASDFGTNSLKSIYWILFITFMYEFILYLYINSYNDAVLLSQIHNINLYTYLEQFNTGLANFINSYLYSLNPLNHMKDILSPYMTSNSPDLISSNTAISIFGIFNFIKNILVGVLIYETIKSFRRFSRKL